MRILTVVGARPQFIKSATISRVIRGLEGVQELIVHTGQHFDANMSEVFFKEMNIPKPHHNLNINSMTHARMTARMMEGIEVLCEQHSPDYLLVYGDTNSTLAGALTAAKLGIDVAHVEAGLRSFNMSMPEEINRILTDRVSSQLFCPTEIAIRNLNTEGYQSFENVHIHLSGDVMYDAAMYYSSQNAQSERIEKMTREVGEFVLTTIHRDENTSNLDRLQEIVHGLNIIHQRTPVICPLHPRTQKLLPNLSEAPSFKIIEPVGYFDILYLLKESALVITDSGGLQKEAYFFDSPCVTVRDQTEWVELVDGGFNVVTGYESESIVKGYESMFGVDLDFTKDLYGDGTAAQRIVKTLIDHKT